MAVRNYTTTIDANKTILEVEGILLKFGAQGIYKEYQGTKVNSITFFINKNGQRIPFKIPMSIEKSRRVVENAVKEGKLPRKFLQEPLRSDQGERIAWRIIKDWIDSQLSLLEMHFADAIEILLPYAYNPVEDKTMYQRFMEHSDKILGLEDASKKEEGI